MMPIEIDLDGRSIAIDGDGNRKGFADAFHHVWLGIPAAERQKMVDHWANGTSAQDDSPQVALVPDYDKPGNNDSFGNALIFNSRVADMMDEAGLLPALIAHELGHVYRYATHAPAHAAFPPDHAAKEDEADEKALEWGCDMQALRAWSNKHAQQLAECGIQIPLGGRW